MNITLGSLIGDFILVAGSFLLLIILIKKFAWENITSTFEQRAKKISDDIDGAESARQKAEDLAQKRETELAGSRQEATTIIENAKETAEKNKAGILADAADEAGRLKEKANHEIAQTKAEALNSIKGDVADLTVNLASKILGQQLDQEAHKELIDKKRFAVIEKYTTPFVQLVIEKGQQKDVFKQLHQMKDILDDTNLVAFLSHIGVDDTEKEKSLRYFQGSDSLLIDNFIEVIIHNHREDLFYDILVESLHQLEMISNEFEVTIKSVQTLSETQKSKIIPIVERKFGLQVRSLKEELDASLIGGFIITANNKTIDASIKRQLQTVKEKLK